MGWIEDAYKKAQNLSVGHQLGFTGDPKHDVDMILGRKPGPNPGAPNPATDPQYQNGLAVYRQIFKNITGTDATDEDVAKFAEQALYPAWIAPGDIGYTDHTALARNFIENNFDLQKLQQEKGKAAAVSEYKNVDAAFQNVLGRSSTAEEQQHFGQMLSNGSLDIYTLSDWLKQLPENIKKEDAAFQQSLRDTTQKEDARYFSEQVLPGIQSTYAKQGRSFDSSGYTSALAQAAQGQNTQREAFLTNLAAQQYQGNKNAAYDAYIKSVGRYQEGQDYAINRNAALSDLATQRLYQTQDYNTQKSAYEDYLKRYGKRSSSASGTQGAIGGATAGATIGASVGGPYGAVIGGVGGGLAGYFGAQNY